MTHREADGTDKIVAYERSDAIFAKLANSTKAAHKVLSPEQAINFVFDGPGIKTFVVDETYLVAYTMVEPWSFGPGAAVVQELLIARLYDGGGTFDGVVDFLNAEAKLFQCVGVIVGTALTRDDRALAKALVAHGFTPLSWEHFKPVE
jgi:hypothetical protein